MVGTQFTTGNQLMETFEHRIAEGCMHLCKQVHAMGGKQAELKSAMYAMATKCQGTAGTANANQAAIQQLSYAIREANKRKGHLLN